MKLDLGDFGTDRWCMVDYNAQIKYQPHSCNLQGEEFEDFLPLHNLNLLPQVIKGTLLSCGCTRSSSVARTRKQWITPPTGLHIPYPYLRHCSLELETHDQTKTGPEDVYVKETWWEWDTSLDAVETATQAKTTSRNTATRQSCPLKTFTDGKPTQGGFASAMVCGEDTRWDGPRTGSTTILCRSDSLQSTESLWVEVEWVERWDIEAWRIGTHGGEDSQGHGPSCDSNKLFELEERGSNRPPWC
ncbi:hypothetical protein CFP56_004901 [Quercus suber]|uniref:Uncharacterized protein n=1 Tax=Quercus suber TaxID=58331 RepID=A0AAW0LBE2_QUESU